MTTIVVVGCGPSLAAVEWPSERPAGVLSIACNRAIEAVPTDYWLWVDRLHYDRSCRHPNARRAARVAAGGQPCPDASRVYRVARAMPCDDDELFLQGGTLTPAAHLALRLGARRIVFVACDAWSDGRTRWHDWDGASLDEAGVAIHRDHLRRTAQGVHTLADLHPDVEFLDATTGPRLLVLRPVKLAEVLPGVASPARMPPADLALPRGYGRLAGVTAAGAGEAILWMEDADRAVRAIRVVLHRDRGLALTILGEAHIARS